MTRKQRIGTVVCIGGAIICLLLATAWVVNAMYWHHVNGNWLDHHITDWEIAPIFCLAGVFVFNNIISRFFDL